MDERNPEAKPELFKFEGGIKQYVKDINSNSTTIGEIVYGEGRVREHDSGVRAPVHLELQGKHLHVRQQHPDNRRRHPSGRLQDRPDPRRQQLRPERGPAQEADPEADRRRRARGFDLCHLGQAARTSVRGSDQDQARQLRGRRPGGRRHLREAERLLRGESQGSAVHHREGGGRGQGARGGPQGPRSGPAQRRSVGQCPSRQAGRLPVQESGRLRDIPR